ncbi:MAG: hypothetical protein JSS66_12605 [Armatimonadetes bacterium]|nr:hypothetical protein [Armatimonadota bacterium]
MASLNKQSASYVSAGVLAVLTLTVFLAEQFAGPASAVTRFQEALMRRNPKLLQSVTAEDIRSQATAQLANMVYAFMAPPATAQITTTEKHGNTARVIVYFRGPYGTAVIPYMLVKREGMWQVDPAATVRESFRQSSPESG